MIHTNTNCFHVGSHYEPAVEVYSVINNAPHAVEVIVTDATGYYSDEALPVGEADTFDFGDGGSAYSADVEIRDSGVTIARFEVVLDIGDICITTVEEVV